MLQENRRYGWASFCCSIPVLLLATTATASPPFAPAVNDPRPQSRIHGVAAAEQMQTPADAVPVEMAIWLAHYAQIESEEEPISSPLIRQRLESILRFDRPLHVAGNDVVLSLRGPGRRNAIVSLELRF